MARSECGRGSESHRQGRTHGTAREARRVAARWTPRPAGPQHRAPTLPLCTASPGAATGPPLSLILFAFLKTLFLQSGFKLTEKLRRYRDSPPISTHVQPLPLWTFLPSPPPRAVHLLQVTHLNRPKSVAYLGAHSRCRTVLRFGRVCDDTCPPLAPYRAPSRP